MSVRRQETRSISLPIGKDTSCSNIRYTKYYKGETGECWFCGQQTKEYRAFSYKKFRSKPGPGYVTNVESTIVLKIWCCQSCRNLIDSQADRVETYRERFGLIGFVVGFLIGLFIFFRYDVFSIAGNLFFSLAITGILGLGIGNLVGKIICRNNYSRIEKRLVHRLNQHPEVIAVKKGHYSRFYYE